MCQNAQHGMETIAREKDINFDELQDVILHIDGGETVASSTNLCDHVVFLLAHVDY